MTALSDKLFQTGRDFLGCRYPFICGAMTWVSDPVLVSSVCNCGAFACLAGGNAPGEILRQQIRETRQLTDRPFAVNLITLSPAYKEQLEMLTGEHPEFVVFAGGIPKDKDIHLMKDAGAKVLCFASSRSLCTRMLSYGADAIILEGMEAGGHVGQVSLSVLLQQVLFSNPGVPVFTAGGITTGRLSAHMLLMGAAGIQLATRFAVSKESRAHDNFKKALLDASARDAVVTSQFDSRLPVAPVRSLTNKGSADFDRLQLEMIRRLDAGEITRMEAQHELEKFWMGALRRAVEEGDTETGSLMAGQSVGLVDKIEPVADIIAELAQDIELELQAVKKALK